MDTKLCPKCKQTLLYLHTVVKDDNTIKYEVLCSWCDYKSKEYDNKMEVNENYENAVLRL